MLSLHQLVSSLTVHPDIKELCHEAQHGPYWYSFAAVAINVTASIHQMLLDGDLDEINYRTGCKLSSLAEIHYEVMKLFHKNWMDARPANLFFFNDIFANTKLEFQVQMGIKR